MLIGIMSDTHDDMDQLRRAVNVLNEKGIAELIHAGDYVAPFTFEILDDLEANFRGIFGNNDGDRLLLAEKSRQRINHQPLLTEVGGLRVAVVHEPISVEALAESKRFDLVIYGHTHVPDVRKAGKALIINPGKTAKLHKGRSTVAVLDTDTMEAEVIEL